MPQVLGRFGRLSQTLSEEKNKIETQASQMRITLKNNQEAVTPPSETSENFEKMNSVLAWLAICLLEGHIEPFQPQVGRYVGWPLRSFPRNSLYVDFECWNRKNSLPKNEIANREIFYSLADKIFEREGESYSFPFLEECKKKFKPLAKEMYDRAESK